MDGVNMVTTPKKPKVDKTNALFKETEVEPLSEIQLRVLIEWDS